MPELVEVWEPLFWVSPLNEDFSRDLQRAFLESRGEDRIWLSPSAEKVTRWEDRADPRLPFRQCQIPSENWNAISVFHVDEQRNVWPKLSYHVEAMENPRGWEGGLPEALYQKWLNSLPAIEIVDEVPNFRVRVPLVTEGKVTYVERTLNLAPGPLLPIESIDRDEDGFLVKMVWPPPGESFPTAVSLEAESKRYFGPLRFEVGNPEEEKPQLVVPAAHPEYRAFSIALHWPKPFNVLFPTGSSIDLCHHWALMRECVKKYESGQLDEARQMALVWAQR